MYTQTYTSGPFFLQTYTSRILASYPTAALRRVSRTGIRSENGAEATRGGDSERRSHDGRRAKRHLPAVVDKRACARTRHREHRIQRDSDKPPCPPPCTAPSPAERKRRANRCGGVIWIRESESLPNNITDDKIHYMLALPSADASAISADFVRLLRPIYRPLSFATRASATAWRITLLQQKAELQLINSP